MTPHFPGLPFEHERQRDPSDDGGLESTPTNCLDRTLAVPSQPRIDAVSALECASAMDVRLCDASTVTPSLPSHPSGGLREPIPDGRYHHAYETEGSSGRELGRGGTGRVFLAFDRTLGRNVAVKELLPDLGATEQPGSESDPFSPSQRFLREARITGQLEHPNIVPIYELGREPSGRLYYTMRVVSGRTLTSAIEEASTLTQRLALVNHFAGLCHAIAYAHSRGVVHRDIKPDNVMIGEFGETCVLDWGLANIFEETSPRSLHSAATLSLPPNASQRPQARSPGTPSDFHTQLGPIIGTPQYMSPEQLLRPREGASPRSDVWSLGVVLYYILTGKHPFSANTPNESMAGMASATITPISEVAPLVPRELAAIAQRALARDPRARYQNAGLLARDIAIYQAGENVPAYGYSSLELLRRFAHSDRSTLLVAAGALTVLICVAGASYLRTASARDAAITAGHRASQEESRAKRNLSDVLIERARVDLSQGDAASAALLAAGALELSERADARGLLVALSNADRLERQPLPVLAEACQKAVWNVSLFRLACPSASALTIHDVRAQRMETITTLAPNSAVFSLNASGWLLQGAPESAQILDADGQQRNWPARRESARVFAGDASGKHIAVANDGGTTTLLALESRQRPKTLRHRHPVTALTFHPTEPVLAIGGSRGEIQLWRWQDQSAATLLGSAHSTIRSMSFGPKGILATGGSDGSLLIWDTTQRMVVLAPTRAASPIVDLSLSPNGAMLALATRGGLVEIFRAETFERTLRFAIGTERVQRLAFASDSSLVGTADDSPPIHLLLRQAPSSVRVASGSSILSLAWAANQSDVLVAGLGERGVCRLSLSDGSCGEKLSVRVGLVRKIAHSAARKLYVIGGTGGRLELWDSERKSPRGFLDVPIPEVRDLRFLPGEETLAVVGSAPSLVLVDVERMRVTDQQPLPSPGQSLLLLPQRQKLAIGLRNGHLLFRSLLHARIDADIRIVSGWPVGIAASERYGWLAIAEDNGRLTFFDLETYRQLDSFTLGTGRITAFAYSEDQQLIATGGEGRDVQVVSTALPRSVMARMDEHQGTVRALLFDDANRRLLSADDAGLVRTWDLGSLRLPPTQLRQKAERTYGPNVKAGHIARVGQ